MDKYGLKEFKDLQTSTITIMVYSNVIFNRDRILEGLKMTKLENVPRTKKKKNIDKKNLKAPYGSILFVDNGKRFRGLNLRKSRLRYCPVCQPVKELNVDSHQRQKKINTVHECYISVENSDINEVRYRCENCEKVFKREELGKTPTYFLNQITVVLSVGDVILNVMLFTDNFKIAGCKKNDDAVHAAMILWQDHISKIAGAYSMKEPNQEPQFLFSLVMRNVDFRLGFPIDRQKLNQLMNSDQYQNRVFMSQCEPTGNTNVNIKMYSKKPKGFKYDCLVFPTGNKPFFKTMEKNLYKKKKKKKYVTLIVFSSSEVILSGRYEVTMREVYEFFVKEAFSNRNLIEEKISPPRESLVSHLRKSGQI